MTSLYPIQRYACWLAIPLFSLAMPSWADEAASIAVLQQQIQALQQRLAQLEQREPVTTAVFATPPTEAANTTTQPAIQSNTSQSSTSPVTQVRVYGQVQMDVLHDFKATAPNDVFNNLPEQPLGQAERLENQTNVTVETSRLGVDFAVPSELGRVKGKFEGDFYTYGDAATRGRFRLRHAYFETDHWLIGQTGSVFSDYAHTPSTADFNGLVGSIWARRPMVRYRQSFGEAGQWWVSAERPSGNARLPNLATRYSHQFAQGALTVRGLLHEKRRLDDEKLGYGVGLGGHVNFTPETKLLGLYSRVVGDGDYVWGAKAMPAADHLDFYRTDSWMLSLEHQLDPQLTAALGYSLLKTSGDTEVLTDNQQLSQGSLSLFYTPIPKVTLGAEYLYGERETFGGDMGKMSRLGLMGRYQF
ncbi:MAG: DcaP family trimeric outer membrane transporter [Pseudomonadota bacterium]|nr:DcaP family trimeric outer membrane transporter [Pseudomonadota bacterium]